MPQTSLAFGPFVLDPGRASLLRDGKPIQVGQRGLALLEALLKADGGVVTKADLMDRGWPGMVVEENNLTVQIAAVRKALGTRPDGEEWIATVPRQGYRLVRTPGATVRPEGPTGIPSIAVLPFANLSSDREQAFFADGVVDDIIFALSRFTSFSVVARNSSFAYKDRPVDVRDVAKALGVRYVLEGSVQRRDKDVRVTAQLIDGTTGAHLLAERFDGKLNEIFAFQDQITEAVAGLVEPQIRRAEIERARGRRPENLDAYDLFLRALPHFYGVSPDGYVSAIQDLERAIALEPDFPLTLAYAAWAYEKRDTIGLPLLRPDHRERCIELARAALKAGGDDPLVLAICGYLLLAVASQKAEGLATVRRALKANPNNVVALNYAGLCNVLAGDLQEGEACYRRACELSPGAPELNECLSGVGFALFFQKDFEGAINWLLRSLGTFTEWLPTYWMLAASYAHLDRMDEARAAIAKVLRITPEIDVAWIERLAARSDERFQLLISGLRKAGLPQAGRN